MPGNRPRPSATRVGETTSVSKSQTKSDISQTYTQRTDRTTFKLSDTHVVKVVRAAQGMRTFGGKKNTVQLSRPPQLAAAPRVYPTRNQA